MNEFWILIIIVGLWIFLQTWLLPRLGIST